MSRLSGLLTKRILIKKALVGLLPAFSGIIQAVKLGYGESIGGILTQLGTLTRKLHARRSLVGLWYATGVITKRIRIQKALSGSFRFVGTLIAKSKEITTGTIGKWVGTLTQRIWAQRGLTSSISEWVGILTKRIHVQESLSGILGFLGTVTAVKIGLKESLAGLLNLTGTITRKTQQKRLLAGTITFIGTLFTGKRQSVAGIMGIIGILSARPIVTETMYYGVENP